MNKQAYWEGYLEFCQHQGVDPRALTKKAGPTDPIDAELDALLADKPSDEPYQQQVARYQASKKRDEQMRAAMADPQAMMRAAQGAGAGGGMSMQDLMMHPGMRYGMPTMAGAGGGALLAQQLGYDDPMGMGLGAVGGGSLGALAGHYGPGMV